MAHIYTHTHIHTHLYNEILLSHKKEWNNVICSNMDEPRDYYTNKVSQRKTNIVWHRLNIESKNKWHKLIYKTEIGSQRKQTYDYQRGKGGGIN